MSDCSIVFTFQDQYGDFQIERLRASRTGTCYQLESIPQFTPAVSKGDIITAVEEEEQLHFEMVLEASGNSTIQLLVFDETWLAAMVSFIEANGCSCEASHENRLMAVNIPHHVHYFPLQLYFEKGEEDGRWTYKESCLSHY